MHGQQETGLHLCMLCPFANDLWRPVLALENLPLLRHINAANYHTIADRWEAVVGKTKIQSEDDEAHFKDSWHAARGALVWFRNSPFSGT